MKPHLPFRDASTHLADIRESIENIYRFIGDMDFEAYKEDRKTKSAVERQLQIISEAAIRLGEDGDRLAPGPDWKNLRGMGNILRHSYHRVDDEIIWNTVKMDLPELLASVSGALSQTPED